MYVLKTSLLRLHVFQEWLDKGMPVIVPFFVQPIHIIEQSSVSRGWGCVCGGVCGWSGGCGWEGGVEPLRNGLVGTNATELLLVGSSKFWLQRFKHGIQFVCPHDPACHLDYFTKCHNSNFGAQGTCMLISAKNCMLSTCVDRLQNGFSVRSKVTWAIINLTSKILTAW